MCSVYVHPRSVFQIGAAASATNLLCRENCKHVCSGPFEQNLLDALVSRSAVHHLASGVVGQRPLLTDSVEKVEMLTGSKFSSLVGTFF